MSSECPSGTQSIFIIYFKENRDACDIVDHCVVLFPFLGAGSDNGVASFFWAILYVIGPDDPSDLLVAQELPYTIARNYDELTVFV